MGALTKQVKKQIRAAYSNKTETAKQQMIKNVTNALLNVLEKYLLTDQNDSVTLFVQSPQRQAFLDSIDSSVFFNYEFDDMGDGQYTISQKKAELW
jgi:phenylpyruvate tautomerase PptA (4-oxalocrotonate tautomerase family)